MAALAELVDHVIGVDPDRDRVTAAVVSVTTQGELASATFPATRRGYGQALRWAKTLTVDERRAWAIESTGSLRKTAARIPNEPSKFGITSLDIIAWKWCIAGRIVRPFAKRSAPPFYAGVPQCRRSLSSILKVARRW